MKVNVSLREVGKEGKKKHTSRNTSMLPAPHMCQALLYLKSSQKSPANIFYLNNFSTVGQSKFPATQHSLLIRESGRQAKTAG